MQHFEITEFHLFSFPFLFVPQILFFSYILYHEHIFCTTKAQHSVRHGCGRWGPWHLPWAGFCSVRKGGSARAWQDITGRTTSFKYDNMVPCLSAVVTCPEASFFPKHLCIRNSPLIQWTFPISSPQTMPLEELLLSPPISFAETSPWGSCSLCCGHVHLSFVRGGGGTWSSPSGDGAQSCS